MSEKSIKDPARCSFCGGEGGQLIAGPDVAICDSCVETCSQILVENDGEKERTDDPIDAWRSSRSIDREAVISALLTRLDHYGSMKDKWTRWGLAELVSETNGLIACATAAVALLREAGES